MGDSADRKGTIIASSIGAAAVIIAALITAHYASSSTTNKGPTNDGVGVSSPTPARPLSFGVAVRDRDSNAPVAQAVVTLAVGNEPIAQAVADDNGQANFSVDPAYSGRRARLFAKSPSYHPADLEMSLTPERKIIQLVPVK